MFDMEDELVRFLEEHGVGPWVVDELNHSLRLDEWVAQFVERHVQPHIDEQAGAAADAAEALDRVTAMLDANPKQQTIAVARLRKAIADHD